MAIEIRNDGSLFLAQVVSAYNAKLDAGLSTECHRDKTATQSGSYLVPASSLLTVSAVVVTEDGYIAGVNNCKKVIEMHFKDDSAHPVADTVNVNYQNNDGYAYPATDFEEACALANAIKVDLNAHFTETDVHVNNDVANTITADDADDSDPDDQTLLGALVLELRTKINAHLASAGATQRYKIISP